MRTIAGAAVLTTFILLATPAADVAAQEADGDDVEAVKSVRDGYFASYEAVTPDSAAAHFTEDGVLLPPAASVARGHEAIRGRIQALTEGMSISLQAISEETKVLDGTVIDRGILGIETTPEGAEEAATDTGKYVLVAENRDGTWKIVWLMWNTDHPLRISSTEEG